MSELLESLNPMQKEAVMYTEGPLLILAGAGSGKTRVLTHRAAYLIEEKGVMPWNILAITFTNKAAGEMRERVDRLCAQDGGKVWVATFHATCVRILRQHAELLGYSSDFTIYDTDDQKTLMKRVLKTLDYDNKIYPEKMLLSRVSSAKNEMKDPDRLYKEAGDFRERNIAEAYAEYNKQLKSNDAMDFDDLLCNTVKLFKEHPEVLASYQERFKYIMVDEYQDTNAVQFLLIKQLASAHKNICVVGDDDQSIYKFRGADIRNILDFEKAFPGAKVIKLEQNYRSTGNILAAANEVIKHNFSRKAKTLWTDHNEGDKVDYREFETGYNEAENVVMDIKANLSRFSYGDCAVLYRTNAQSRLFEEKCVLYNVPYKLVGGVNFYQRREIKDIIAYLKTIVGGQDDISVQRIINVPKRGIGQTTITKIQDIATARGINFYDALTDADSLGLNKGTADKIKSFTKLIDSIRADMGKLSVKELVEAVADRSGYRAELAAEKTIESESRLENIEELVAKAAEFPDEAGDSEALSMFLEEVALIADVDTLDDEENRVVLMTLHGAKGLEFPRVYMAGMEEGLFPSNMSIATGNEEDIEEERRLCYVGITRAREKLTLSAARSRVVNGDMRYSAVSRFLREIPASLLEKEGRTPLAKPPVMRQPQLSVKIPSVNPGIYMMKDMKSAGAPDYEAGDRVSHIKFGEGTVLALEKGSRDYEVTVKFDSVGEKKLFASFAKLTKI